MRIVLRQLAMIGSLLLSSFALADAPAAQAARPTIEVCFVLDTTGSMGGLIDGAKAKIWSIANEIIRTEPRPQVRLALIGYRDRGDEYITRAFDLTDDIDMVYKNLQSFRADGGGDGPESVNQALHEAVTKIKWNGDKDVTKIIFLVGDYPPHMDYDDLKYPQVCQEAVKKDLIINTVQCGQVPQTTTIWQEIARLGEGSYVALGQTGDMVVITTPFDKDLSELNTAMNATVVPYGAAPQQEEVRAKVAMAGGAPAAAAADRLAYNLASGKAVQGRGDLLDDLRDNAVKLEDLKRDELPADLRKMTNDELKAYIEKQSAARSDLQKQIAELSRKRQEFIDAENKRLAKQTGKLDSFDAKVAEMVKEQAARKR